MKRVVLVLVGQKQSGKTTVSNRLRERHGFGVFQIADQLKAMLRAMGLTEEEIEGRMKDEPCPLLQGRTPRYAMETLGHEWGRVLMHPYLWVDMAIRAVENSALPRVVIQACRFPDEAQRLRERLNPIFVRILGRGERVEHASGQSIDDIPADKYLDNCGTIDELHELVDLLAESLTKV